MKPICVEVPEPLKRFAADYVAALARDGFSESTAEAHMYLMAHVSRWLAVRGLAPVEFVDERVVEYLDYRRASGHVRRLTPRGLIPLTGFLRQIGVTPAAAPTAPDAVGRLLDEFVVFCDRERGLSPRTIAGYRRTAALFLTSRSSSPLTIPAGVGVVTAIEVHEFVLVQSRSRRAGALGNLATGLRALTRFLYVCGYTTDDLTTAVPKAPCWRDSGIARSLSTDDVVRLLDGCDRDTPAGLRDFAILTVFARLGLRAREVAMLTVDDVDWRNGELAVCGKGNRHDRLPLPDDVGRAIADYCQRGRRRGDCRSLFVHVRAPYSTMTSCAVSNIVARACLRVGIAPVGAHRLRHMTATALRRAGAPLFEISQVLRHRHTVTSVRYAKDDLDMLATIAPPWPGMSS